MKRLTCFAYGAVCYSIFFATFLYAIGWVGNLVVPKSIDSAAEGTLAAALLIDCGLLTLFALQHSIMARPAFKKRWTRVVPQPLERSTYVLFSSVALLLLFWLWRPIGGTVWQVDDPVARATVYGLFAFGWGLVLASTFLINHFDLFGLRQVWLYLRGKEYTPLPFKTPGPYRLVRHPLYVGWFFAFWATPTMTAAHLVFALATTAYILLAIQLEERDLTEAHPEYTAYRRRVPMLIPFTRRSTSPTGTGTTSVRAGGSALVLLLVVGLLGFAQAPAQATETEGSAIWAFSDGLPVRGAAQLTRGDTAITFVWNPTELPVYNAYTTWIVAFNQPQNCAVPNHCAEVDLFSDDVQTAIIHGGGGVSDGWGQVTISGTRAYGDTSGLVVGPSAAITNPNAEIHLVLRRHFRAYLSASKREGQLTTFDDGCHGACPDTHFAIFPPRRTSTYQTAEMLALGTFAESPGAATLVRSSQTLQANMAMSGLDPLSTYTVWWVIWNDPGNCTDGCGEDDLFIEDNSIFYATGFIADGSGTANAHAEARSGDTPLGADNFTGNPGLQPGKGFKAEVHLVVRRHEPPTVGSVGAQIGTFEPPPGCPETVCFDQYAFVFSPTP